MEVLIGRESESEAIEQLINHVNERGTALLVRGAAGIGKSALLSAVREKAHEHGMRALYAIGVQSEARLPFAGLHQLLRPILDDAADLPAPQRDALLAAFGMAPATRGPDVFLIALAVLNLLSNEAARSPLLVVIDDVQWLDRSSCDVVAAIRDLTGGTGADVVFECAGGSPKQGLAGTKTLRQAIEAVRSGGKLIGVSWFGGPFELDVDALRERSLRYLFPDISTQAHLEHTVRLVATGRVSLRPVITHVLAGIESVPQAFEITANKGKYHAINPAQVMMRGYG
jgi:hypothetical protein